MRELLLRLLLESTLGRKAANTSRAIIINAAALKMTIIKRSSCGTFLIQFYLLGEGHAILRTTPHSFAGCTLVADFLGFWPRILVVGVTAAETISSSFGIRALADRHTIFAVISKSDTIFY